MIRARISARPIMAIMCPSSNTVRMSAAPAKDREHGRRDSRQGKQRLVTGFQKLSPLVIGFTKGPQFSASVTVLRTERLPERARPVGYAARIEGGGLQALRHAPAATLQGHLVFALKYEALGIRDPDFASIHERAAPSTTALTLDWRAVQRRRAPRSADPAKARSEEG